MRLASKICRFYDKIFPYIKRIKGAHRLKRLLNSIALYGVRKIEEEPLDAFKEKWDVLLILDACRHDLLEETIKKKVGSRNSMASRSAGFIEKNFSKGDYSDMVVITANPHFHQDLFEDLTGRKVENVFHTVYHTYQTNWDDERGTVMPVELIKDYKSAKKLFPEKRFLLHFMQPHNPFIGSDLEDVTGFSQYMGIKGGRGGLSEWDLAAKGVLKDEEVWKMYKSNLEFILGVLEENEDVFEGKTMVTSDHGNLVGEGGLYDHPAGRDEKVLRRVPWLDFEELF